MFADIGGTAAGRRGWSHHSPRGSQHPGAEDAGGLAGLKMAESLDSAEPIVGPAIPMVAKLCNNPWGCGARCPGMDRRAPKVHMGKTSGGWQ